MEETAKEAIEVVREWFKRGVQQMDAGRWGEAEAIFRQMLTRWPRVPEVHLNLGTAIKNQTRPEEAIVCFERAVALRPGFLEALNNLGDTLRETNRQAQAVETFQRALQIRPDFPDAWNNLGITYFQMNRPKQAIEAYRRALSLRPQFPEAWNNLGNTLVQANQLTHAIDAFRRALAARPDFSIAWSNLSGALKDTGQLDEALTSLGRAISLSPNQVGTHDSRLCTIHYHPGYDAKAIFEEARRWNERFVKPVAGEIPVHDNTADPARRLRIGYLAPDFRRHCQSLFTPPLLIHHDRAAFEIFCYSSVAAPDPVTVKIRGYGHVWRDIAGLTDRAAAQLVHRDKIDILLDLTLHMAGNRLGIFARKPAPIQVTWLGYPGTTGLETMDYRITDPRLDPPDLAGESEIRNSKFDPGAPGRKNAPNSNDPMSETTSLFEKANNNPGPFGRSSIGGRRGEEFDSSAAADQISNFATQEPYYTERSVRLPDSFWCYDPRGMEDTDHAEMPDPGPLPALAAGKTTFGCLNNFCKVSDPTLALWGRVMAALPNSRLILLSPPGPHRALVIQKLGVAPERVEFVPFLPRRKYLETYRRIDLCLDTIPYNGHTTSLDALWMGVPVVTRAGHTVVGRGGLSQLHHLDLPELIARTDEQFIAAAVDLAGDIDRLCRLRAALRQRMERSPLMDAPRFTRNMESVYRQMWQSWCAARR